MEQREKDWNKRYLDRDHPWEEESPSYELENLLFNYSDRDAKILEIGCGLGTNALFVASLGYNVTATDISTESIRLAKTRKNERGKIDFFPLDFINEIPIDTYDVVYERGCFHSFFHQDSLNCFSNLVANSLNEDGIWITISGNADHPDNLELRKKNSYPRLSLRQIALAIEPHFEVLEIKRSRFGETNSFHSWVGVFKRRTYFYD